MRILFSCMPWEGPLPPARAACAGAVVLRPDDVTAGSVRAALERVLDDPSLRAGAEGIAAEIAAMPFPAEVAAAVEAHVARG